MCNLNRRSVFGGNYVEFTIANLVAGELATMVSLGLAPMVAAGFLTKLTPAVKQDTYDHIVGRRLRVVLDNSKSSKDLEFVSFMASEQNYDGCGHFGHDLIYYLAGMIVDEKHRGIGGRLLDSDLKITRATQIALQTQNLYMLNVVEKLTDYDFQLTDASAESIGTPLEKKRYRELQGRGMNVIHSERYGASSLYSDLEQFNNRGMKIPGIEPETGDAIVYVGRIK